MLVGPILGVIKRERKLINNGLKGKTNLCSWFFINLRGDYFRFGSVFTFKKQPNRKAKKRKIMTQTEPEPVRTDRFRFGLGPVF
jgi:hypothetical protein